MISTFDLGKLHSLLKDFYTLTQIRITVFDETFKELVAYPDHISDFCQIIRTDRHAREKCRDCDRHACQTAAHRRSAYTYICHAGLTESIMPLYMGNIVIGYLFFGHVFSYKSHEEGWEKIKKLCHTYDVDFTALKRTCFGRPVISEEYILSAAHILQAVAAYLCLERMAILRHKELPFQIDEYITAHYAEDLDTRAICSHFGIGKTHLYEIAKQNYGMGIAEHIRNLRIDKAKKLLVEYPGMPISEIAPACGFHDYNYFITVFGRLAGQSPKQFQKKAGASFRPGT